MPVIDRYSCTCRSHAEYQSQQRFCQQGEITFGLALVEIHAIASLDLAFDLRCALQGLPAAKSAWLRLDLYMFARQPLQVES